MTTAELLYKIKSRSNVKDVVIHVISEVRVLAPSVYLDVYVWEVRTVFLDNVGHDKTSIAVNDNLDLALAGAMMSVNGIEEGRLLQ